MNEDARYTITFSISTSSSKNRVEIRQKTIGEMQPIPSDYLNNYVSPSGGFINYAFYKIKGINNETGRKSTKTVQAFDESDAIAKAQENGLYPPYDVTVTNAPLPTEAQLSYAKDLGIILPHGVCKEDVSCLISRVIDNDENPPDKWTVDHANSLNMHFSRYIGNRALLNYVTQTIISNKKAEMKKRPPMKP